MITGLLFLTLILYIYDGNFNNYYIVIQGTLLFMLCSFIMEKVMSLFYLKYKLITILRIQLTTISGLCIYSFVVFLTRPWLLKKMFNAPVFVITIFPMFLIFSILFEIYFQKNSKDYNDQLRKFKGRNRSINYPQD